MSNGKFAAGSGVLMSLAMVSGAFAQASAPAAASVPAVSAEAGPFIHGSMACSPGMPQQAARAGAQGTSRIRFYVDASGKVTATEIVESSGPTREHRMLDNAARQALAQCPFTPAHDENGNPRTGAATVEYRWVLH